MHLRGCSKVYRFSLDGQDCTKYGLVVEKRQDEESPEPDYHSYGTIPGMDGDIETFEGTFRSVTTNIICNFVEKDDTLWHERFRKIKRWLLKGGERILIYSDDPSFFRKVTKITLGTTEREFIESGHLTITFKQLPYEYLIDGTVPRKLIGNVMNIYSKSLPIYIVTGPGTARLTVNSETLEVNIDGTVYVDVYLQLCYKWPSRSGASYKGDISKLFLKEDLNTISITEGFDLKVIPNWRCI